MKKLLYIFGGIILLVIFSVASERQKIETELELLPQPSSDEKAQSEKKDYVIQFTAEHLGGRSFKVDGTTNLPEEASIYIEIYDEDYHKHDNKSDNWRLTNLTYISFPIIAKNGKFNKTVKLTELMAPLKSDKYKVEVSFNPRAQTDSIKKIVGKDGEYLGGKFLDTEIKGLTMITVTKLISLKK